MKSQTIIRKNIAVAGILLAAMASSGGGLAKEASGAGPRFDLDPQPPLREGALGGYSKIVEQAAPSVVSVLSSRRPVAHEQRNFFFLDPHTGRLQQVPNRNVPSQNAPQPHGLGSGVILTSDGYIVTNRHVVAGADQVKVAVGEPSKIYDAKVVGTDEATDVAVLKINATGLPAVKLGDSRTLKVGDFVLALGSPYGLQHTVTTGIVSALERTELGLTGQAGYENFIQTDASINPGNSGGALVDNRGRMIGINTAIFSRSGGNVGIGFAIPSDLAAGVAEQLIEFGEVRRGFLGVTLGDLSPELATAMNVGRQGVIVHQVVNGSPAEKAGLKPGDVIVGYRKNEVSDSAELRLMVGATRPDTEVEFKVIRDGKDLVVKAVVGSRNESGNLSAATAEPWDSGSSHRYEFLEGVKLASLDRELRARLGLPREVAGVLIEQVTPDTPAAKAGLQQGDIITEVARQPVHTVEEAIASRQKAADANGKGALLLRVLNKNGARFVAVELS